MSQDFFFLILKGNVPFIGISILCGLAMVGGLG